MSSNGNKPCGRISYNTVLHESVASSNSYEPSLSTQSFQPTYGYTSSKPAALCLLSKETSPDAYLLEIARTAQQQLDGTGRTFSDLLIASFALGQASSESSLSEDLAKTIDVLKQADVVIRRSLCKGRLPPENAEAIGLWGSRALSAICEVVRTMERMEDTLGRYTKILSASSCVVPSTSAPLNTLVGTSARKGDDHKPMLRPPLMSNSVVENPTLVRPFLRARRSTANLMGLALGERLPLYTLTVMPGSFDHHSSRKRKRGNSVDQVQELVTQTQQSGSASRCKISPRTTVDPLQAQSPHLEPPREADEDHELLIAASSSTESNQNAAQAKRPRRDTGAANTTFTSGPSASSAKAKSNISTSKADSSTRQSRRPVHPSPTRRTHASTSVVEPSPAASGSTSEKLRQPKSVPKLVKHVVPSVPLVKPRRLPATPYPGTRSSRRLAGIPVSRTPSASSVSLGYDEDGEDQEESPKANEFESAPEREREPTQPKDTSHPPLLDLVEEVTLPELSRHETTLTPSKFGTDGSTDARKLVQARSSSDNLPPWLRKARARGTMFTFMEAEDGPNASIPTK